MVQHIYCYLWSKELRELTEHHTLRTFTDVTVQLPHKRMNGQWFLLWCSFDETKTGSWSHDCDKVKASQIWLEAQYSPIAAVVTLHGAVMLGLPLVGCGPSPPLPPLSCHLWHSANPEVQLHFSEASLHYITSAHTLHERGRGRYTLTRMFSVGLLAAVSHTAQRQD